MILQGWRVLRGAVVAIGTLFWNAAEAELPEDFVFRSDAPEAVLPLLRDAVVDALRGFPRMEPGYPRRAMIRTEDIPGRTGEKRLHFDPTTQTDAAVQGILLDFRGSAQQLKRTMQTAGPRLITVYLPAPGETLAADMDYFRVPQIEIGWPYLAPGSRLDAAMLRRAIEPGLRRAGVATLIRPPVPEAEPVP